MEKGGATNFGCTALFVMCWLRQRDVVLRTVMFGGQAAKVKARNHFNCSKTAWKAAVLRMGSKALSVNQESRRISHNGRESAVS